MKKYSFLLTLLSIAVIAGLSSCKKNNLAVDVDTLEVPSRSQFALYDAVPFAKALYVQQTAPFDRIAIPVGITTVSNADRTIQFTYSSVTGAQNGVHFTAPASVTIPAGKVLDTLRLIGNFNNIPAGVAHPVKIKITGGDVPSFTGKDSITITLRRYCEVILANLSGDYNNTFEGSYGPYTASVTNLTATSATTATATITNIYDSGIDAVATFDWSDPANFKVTIASQPTPYTSGGLPLFVRGSGTTASTFSSCDNTITLNLELYTSAGLYDAFTMSMAK